MRLSRLLKHRWVDDSQRSLSPAGLARLTQQVAQSETRHSGEIRLCIEAGLPNSYLLRRDNTQTLIHQRALAQFSRLHVWDTACNNGVLIYLLLAEHSIEVVADRGLNQHVNAAAWQAVVFRLSEHLKAGAFEIGLSQALAEVSDLLALHFPLVPGARNPNELPDDPALA